MLAGGAESDIARAFAAIQTMHGAKASVFRQGCGQYVLPDGVEQEFALALAIYLALGF